MKRLRTTFYMHILTILLSLPPGLEAQNDLDLFILTGQSNAQGWMGNAAEYPADGEGLDTSVLLNWTFFGQESSEGKWVSMQSQKGRFPQGHFGPEVSLGRELKKAGYHPAIFKYCLGATGLVRDWKAPGAGGIYDQMTIALSQSLEALTRQGYRVNIRGFIWIQGESDAGNEETAAAYEVNLIRLIHHLRNEVLHEPRLKVILGVDEQHVFVQKRPVVVRAQKKIANQDENIIFTSMYGLPKADATHLTPGGLVDHGKRLFEAFEILNGRPQPESSFANQWEYVGIAVEEPGYTIWGTSPIMSDDGKVHLFVARWPCELKVDPGWRTHSEIAHYVGDSPEGPFVFSDVAMKGEITAEGEGIAPHNPTVHRIDSVYALFYIANDGIRNHPSNQYICMAVSESLYGPWKKAGEDGVILRPPENRSYWNYRAGNGVNNPAFLQHPDGGFFLYFKSEKARMGLAVAEKPEGPYVQLPFPVTANNRTIEDGYAFMYKGKFALLTTDNHGMIETGGGILWTSDDGIHFQEYEKGMHRIADYHGGKDYTDASVPKIHYGPVTQPFAKPERPQILLIDGQPAYLYVGSGHNIYGGDCTVSYVLKFK